MKKKVYFKEWVELALDTIAMLIIGFIGCTIENIGNTTYNKILVVLMIVLVVIGAMLNKWGKGANFID